MNPQIKTLGNIFKNDPKVFLEERVNLNTGTTDYGIVVARSLDLKEIHEMYRNGFRTKFIGSPAAHQLVLIVKHLGEKQ